MTEPSTLSLSEASELAGVSKDTIWRAVQAEQLQADKMQAGRGFRYRIRREALDSWILSRCSGPSTISGVVEPESIAEETLPVFGREPNELLEALKTVQSALQVASTAQSKASELEQELGLEREARARAERQALEIAAELNSYRRVLTEQAESLAQERARRMTLEHRAEEQLRAQVESQSSSEGLKLGTPTPARGHGWGHRMRHWLGMQTG